MKQNNAITIAIADYFPALIKGLKIIVESLGNFKVIIEAQNGLELIQQIEESSIKPDICLLDISMPKMNGYEALVIIKDRWKHMKVIMQSIFYNEYNIIKAFRGGAAAFFPKNASPEEIKNIIEGVCKHCYYYSEWEEAHVLPCLQDKSVPTNLSDKEQELLRHICSDMTYQDIAEKMCKSTRTVEGYRDTLFHKLNLKNRTELVIFAIRSGIVSIH